VKGTIFSRSTILFYYINHMTYFFVKAEKTTVYIWPSPQKKKRDI